MSRESDVNATTPERPAPSTAPASAVVPALVAPFLAARDLVVAAPVCRAWEDACGANDLWRERCAADFDARRAGRAHAAGFFRRLYLSVVEETIEEWNLVAMGH